MKKQIFDVTFRCEAPQLSTVIAAMSNTAGVTLRGVAIAEPHNGDISTPEPITRHRSKEGKAQDRVVEFVRLRGRATYNDIYSFIIGLGYKPGTVSSSLSELKKQNRVVPLGNGFYGLTETSK